MMLDLEATSFSEQNAFFFTAVCKLSYDNKDEAKSALESQGFWGSGAEAGDRFEWFEVRIGAAKGGVSQRLYLNIFLHTPPQKTRLGKWAQKRCHTHGLEIPPRGYFSWGEKTFAPGGIQTTVGVFGFVYSRM